MKPKIIRIALLLILSACSMTTRGGGPAPIVANPTPNITASPEAGSPAAGMPMPTGDMPPGAAPTPTAIATVDAPSAGPPTATPLADLALGELPTGAAAYSLPLTTRHVGEDRANLFFELSAPGEGYLLYQEIAPQPGETHAVALNAAEPRQQITLEGLSPGAEYRAVVGLRDAVGRLYQPAHMGSAWGSLRFRTLSKREPLRIGVLGDASFGDPATTALVQTMAGRDLDFAIHTGDVVYDVQDHNSPFEAFGVKYYQALSGLLHRMPVYTVIGNHDYDAPARWLDSVFYYYAFPPFPDPLFAAPPQPGKNQFYAFAVNGIQFMLLDTQAIFGQPGREAQDAWMAERLADPRFRYTIPVMHVPPFFSGAVHPEDQVPVRQSWRPLFDAARVPLVLSGHSHHYERLADEGVTYIVSGGGSGTLYAQGETVAQSQVFARRTHFVELLLYADRIELAAIDLNGEVFDQVTVRLP